MRHMNSRKSIPVAVVLLGTLAVSGCQKPFGEDVRRADIAVNAIEGTGINDIMLNAADPAESVSFFSRTLNENPGRIDLMRGLGKSLVRAGDATSAAKVWKRIVAHEETTNDDLIDYADALIRAGDWDEAEAQLDKVPPTYETYKRYRLEAMVADSNQEWKKADSFYDIAAGLTTKPASVLNNWGFSKMTRGEFKDAEALFARAITYDTALFTAKNNLVLARGAQGKYELPVMQMTQEERAQLLYTMGLAAVKAGDVSIGKGIIRESIDTHPQHFEAAVRSLRALEANVSNG